MPTTLTFIDLETTGLSPARDRVIEIGILRMQNGRITRTFTSLVNPECTIPPEITMLTGITAGELDRAPVFSQIIRDIEPLFGDALFVAHNARFDYSFMRAEFSRLDKTFTSPILCTAKLSRTLFPRYKRHSLDSVIDRLGISVRMRHRAMDDARALAEFYRRVKKQFGTDVLSAAITHVTKTAALPKSIAPESVRKLPESAGVYIFYGETGQPLYIGKSINVKERVRSHFYDFSRSNKEARIFNTISSVEAIPTSGELGALLLESRMIKELQPLYNRKLRRASEFIVLLRETTLQGYDTVSIHTAPVIPEDINRILAVYRTRGQMKTAIRELAREYSLCQKLLGLEKTSGRCFGSRIETCNGACAERELPARYNLRFTEAFHKTRVRQWPFPEPVSISEGVRAYIIDRWCYIGDTGDPEAYPEEAQMQFDYDTYRILVSHLLHAKNTRHIRVLKPRT